MAKFQLYRKAIVALVVAALGLLATFIPGIESILSPTEIQVVAGVLAAIAVAVTADKLDGASVVDLARLVVEALDKASHGDPAAPPAVAGRAVMRLGDPVPMMISAIPADDPALPGQFAILPALLSKGGAA